MSENFKPYVPASQSPAEFTAQAVFLGFILSLVMCAANVYVGLYAGMTVSAAIPASVISMGILRGLLKRGTILENNIVHTMASSGESLAAGIIFTVPAIVLLGIWSEFKYLETTLIALAGGVMGVVMMIPLRKAMIIDQKELRFPEGVACAEVLKAGDAGGSEMRGIFTALGIGGLFKVLVEIVGLFRGTVEGAVKIGKTGLYGGTDISPMLMAVGFIVGWEVSLLVFLGGAISFLGALPLLAWNADLSGGATGALMDIWDAKIRFFGIGAMVVGGVYSIVKIAGSMGSALKTAIGGIRSGDTNSTLRTEQSITGRALFGALAVSVVLSSVVYWIMTKNLLTVSLITVVMFVLAFFFVAVASYIAGLVGSSNSPVSGMTICTVIFTGGLLIVLGYTGTSGMLATLGVAGVVCCATCTSGDICQDLKIAHIIGATPKRLQWGELLGVTAAAFIIAPTMNLLQSAYGIGTVDGLKAPQGVMFSKLVGGLFGASEAIPWDLVQIGGVIGVIAILIDRMILEPKQAKFRMHIMPLAVGMYLPWTVTVPILFGGLAYMYVERQSTKRGDDTEARGKVIHRGLLFASGIVAGEAILGIVNALIKVSGLSDPLLGSWNTSESIWPDLLSLAALGFMVWLVIRRSLASPKKLADGS